MAATSTEKISRAKHPAGGYVLAIEWTWKAHTDGAVTSAVSRLTGNHRIQGFLIGLKTQDGGTNPSGGYTATVSDEDSHSPITVTGTVGTTTYVAAPTVTAPVPWIDTAYLDLTVASAGDGGQGVTTLYIWSFYDLAAA